MAKVIVEFTVHAELEISDDVLNLCTEPDRWLRAATREDVAQHIAYNMVKNDLSLSQIDALADRDDSEARRVRVEWDCESLKISAAPRLKTEK